MSDDPIHSVERVLERIATMRLRDTVVLWRNAIRIVDDRRKKKQHAAARIVLDAIGREWNRRRHLPENPDDIFDWPSTDAPGGSGNLNTENWIENGVLKFMGYQVGATQGQPKRFRERILSELFVGPIPPAFPPSHLDGWGEPSSARRLQKMAEAIASFTRNAKRRRSSNLRLAIHDWESDLDFLYHEYYVERFHFAWPESSV